MREHNTFIDNQDIKECLKFKKDAKHIFENIIKKNIKSKNAVVLVAEINSRLAGYAMAHIDQDNPIFEEEIGYGTDLFVNKDYRGKGTGDKLKNELIRWLKGKKIKYLSIGMFKDNESAYKLYKKWGFFDYHLEMRKRL